VKDNVARKLAIEVSEDDLMNTALSLARNQFAQRPHLHGGQVRDAFQG
jgi:hypothetical protein